tara:strand:+ start:412 stop:567 length:156 start_codon:yes stop_codon:yes gene_type:complete
MLSVENQIADKPDMIKAVNIRENTLDTKLLVDSLESKLADWVVVGFMFEYL